MKNILYYLIPFISFISLKLGRKIINYICDQDENRIHSYLHQIRLLRKCYFSSLLYFLVFYLVLLTIFMIVFKFNPFKNHLYFILATIMAGSNIFSSKRKCKYPFLSHTQDSSIAMKKIEWFFYIIAFILFQIHFFLININL